MSKKTVRHIDDAIYVVDPERDKILDINPRACSMLGYSREELLSLPVSAVHPSEMPKFLAFAKSVFEKGNGWIGQLTCLTRLGVALPVEISASTIDIGGRTCMISLVRDITERKQAEEMLQEREEQYRDLYENAPVAYYSVSIDGRIHKANQRAEELFGYALDDLIGKPVFDLYADTPAGKEKAQEVFQRVRDGEEISGEELEICRRDGRQACINLTVRPIRDAEGRFMATRSMAVDITKRKQAERALLDEVKIKYDYEEIIGKSAVLQNVLKQVELVATTDTTILVLGETGTGKELICRAVHHLSPRNARPLIKLNCASIPSGLIESELFGHEKGAFTGAISQKQGRFELAHGGTIFLDEIGDLPIEAQTKLLRVLEDQEFERVGGTRTVKIDTRAIAATHRDLEQMIKEGSFRQDLFYRLNVFPVRLPPLRDRREDIPLLANNFARRMRVRLGRPLCEISGAAMQRLLAYPWPGNVRELENIMERAALLCDGPTIDREHIQVEVNLRSVAEGEGQVRPLHEVERAHIIEALRAANGRVSGKGGAAELLGLKPTTLESRMKRLGISRMAF